jgi:hypothetical protein
VIPLWLVVTVWALVGAAGVGVLFVLFVGAIVDVLAERKHGSLSPAGEHPYEEKR